MVVLNPNPALPLTGFALYQRGRLLLLQGGNPTRLSFSEPDQLNAEAYKQLLWLIEEALGARRNELAQTEPSSIRSLLRVIALCLANQPRDRFTGAILARGIRPLVADTFFSNADHAEPSGGIIRQSVAGVISRIAVPPGVHPTDLEGLGGVSAAGGPDGTSAAALPG